MDKFRIDRDEVDNQVDQMRDHEFKRGYTDWNRVLRNWFRTADKHHLLTRKITYRGPELVTDNDRDQDSKKAWEEMEKLAGRRLREGNR